MKRNTALFATVVVAAWASGLRWCGLECRPVHRQLHIQPARQTIAFVLTLLLLPSCRLSDKIRDYHEMSDTADTEAGSSDPTDEDPGPAPTTSTTTGAATGTVDPATTSLPDLPDTEVVEIVSFTADLGLVARAGPVLLSAEVVGPVEDMSLEVIHADTNYSEDIPWPVGQTTLEYVVNTSKRNGTLEFRLQATGPDEAEATLALPVDMPPGGTLDARWEGEPGTRGTALALLPGSGLEPDTVVVVGQGENGELLVGQVVDEQLKTDLLDPMLPHAVAVDPSHEFIYVAGENQAEEMTVRKYTLNLGAYWERTYPDAVAQDVQVSPDGEVVVAGYVRHDSHTEAAVWLFDTDGTSLAEPAIFSEVDEFNDTFASEITGLVFVGDRVVAAGSREEKLVFDVRKQHAVLFEYSMQELQPITIYPATLENEQSSWRGVSGSATHVYTVGDHKQDDDTPPTIAYGRFSSSLGSEQLSSSLAGFGEGEAIAWHPAGYSVMAGSRLLNGVGKFWAGSQAWPAAYLDEFDGTSEARDVAVGRHGYIYVLGTSEPLGWSRMILARLGP